MTVSQWYASITFLLLRHDAGYILVDSQKIISQGRKLSSSLDYDAVDVYCGDAMNDREAVADAVVAGAIRDAAADASISSFVAYLKILPVFNVPCDEYE